MAQLVIPNAAIAKLNWSQLSRTYQNVLGLLGVAALPTIDQTLANNLMTDAAAAFASSGLNTHMNNATALQSVSIRDISAANRFEFVSTQASVPGTLVTEPLPLNVASVVTLRTAGAGRSFRGRVYFGGFTETENDGTGRAIAAVNTVTVAFLNALNTAWQARGLRLAVLSRPRDQVVIPERTIPGKAGFASPVTAVIARNLKWESQRRRTGRV